jgi:NDP-4-keto-2,6-dideoxyhexose 3-C-methyltransferase
VNRCCACSGRRLDEVLNLGLHYLADFTDPGAPRQREPLRLVLCRDCELVQLGEFTPRPALYHERYGYKSGVNEAAAADLHDIARYALGCRPRPGRWLDIGSNDGTLLAAVPQDVYRAGVDPLGQFADEARTHADRIDVAYFSPELYSPGEFDVITSGAMFYDLERPGEFAAQVKSVLAPDGVWVIQQNYALHMLLNNVVDNICHEHLTYFTVGTLNRLLGWHGLEITDVEFSGVKGGCIRTAVSHVGRYSVSKSVQNAVNREKASHTDSTSRWQQWGLDVQRELAGTRRELDRIAARGERTYIYGASTRGGTFLQIIGASPEILQYAVDRNPAKVGKVMASTGITIISEDDMRRDPPENLLIAPWFFRDVFLEREADYLKNGGRMIFPLPEFEIVQELSAA